MIAHVADHQVILALRGAGADRWADELRTRLAPVHQRLEKMRQALAAQEAAALPYERALEALTTRQRVEARVVVPPLRSRDGEAAAQAVAEIQEAFEESRRAPHSTLEGRR